MMIVERERMTLNLPKAAPTGRPMSLPTARVEVPPAIADDVIRPMSMVRMILLNCFFFLACRLRSSIS